MTCNKSLVKCLTHLITYELEANPMISSIIGILFSVSVGVIALLTNKVNGNPYKLTLRGKRLLFIVAFLIGLLINQIALNLYWTGDGYKWL
jgi:hypothetical protein